MSSGKNSKRYCRLRKHKRVDLPTTVVRAHQHAAGAKGGQQSQALGRSKGGFSTKIHIRAEGFGKPMHFVLTSGETHDTKAFEALMVGGKVKRVQQGRPKHRPRYFVGDKAFSSTIRQSLFRRGITPIVPQRSNERRSRLNPWTVS